jgi:hypothetical protein
MISSPMCKRPPAAIGIMTALISIVNPHLLSIEIYKALCE